MRYRSRSFFADDDLYAESTQTMDVLHSEVENEKTGLVDQFGHDIYRVPERNPIGFKCKPRVRVKAGGSRL